LKGYLYHVGHHPNLFNRGVDKLLFKARAKMEKVSKDKVFPTLSVMFSR
jgi:hypothetical protein